MPTRAGGYEGRDDDSGRVPTREEIDRAWRQQRERQRLADEAERYRRQQERERDAEDNAPEYKPTGHGELTRDERQRASREAWLQTPNGQAWQAAQDAECERQEAERRPAPRPSTLHDDYDPAPRDLPAAPAPAGEPTWGGLTRSEMTAPEWAAVQRNQVPPDKTTSALAAKLLGRLLIERSPGLVMLKALREVIMVC